MSKLKVGDRVAAYIGGTVDHQPHRVIAEIEEVDIHHPKGMVRIIYGKGTDEWGRWVVHPKQCRKLIRREPRRVWIFESPGLDNNISWTPPPNPSGWIEFQEVRKMK